MTTPTKHLDNMAYAFDEATDDSDGEIGESYELLDAMFVQLLEAGVLTRCSNHGLYATFRGQCPPCHYCSDCEESPCECEDEEYCSECEDNPCACEELT